LKRFIGHPIFEREGGTRKKQLFMDDLPTEACHSRMTHGNFENPLDDPMFQHHPAGLLEILKQSFDLGFREIWDIPVIRNVEWG
jgi:hypothetical protein